MAGEPLLGREVKKGASRELMLSWDEKEDEGEPGE